MTENKNLKYQNLYYKYKEKYIKLKKEIIGGSLKEDSSSKEKLMTTFKMLKNKILQMSINNQNTDEETRELISLISENKDKFNVDQLIDEAIFFENITYLNFLLLEYDISQVNIFKKSYKCYEKLKNKSSTIIKKWNEDFNLTEFDSSINKIETSIKNLNDILNKLNEISNKAQNIDELDKTINILIECIFISYELTYVNFKEMTYTFIEEAIENLENNLIEIYLNNRNYHTIEGTFSKKFLEHLKLMRQLFLVDTIKNIYPTLIEVKLIKEDDLQNLLILVYTKLYDKFEDFLASQEFITGSRKFKKNYLKRFKIINDKLEKSFGPITFFVINFIEKYFTIFTLSDEEKIKEKYQELNKFIESKLTFINYDFSNPIIRNLVALEIKKIDLSEVKEEYQTPIQIFIGFVRNSNQLEFSFKNIYLINFALFFCDKKLTEIILKNNFDIKKELIIEFKENKHIIFGTTLTTLIQYYIIQTYEAEYFEIAKLIIDKAKQIDYDIINKSSYYIPIGNQKKLFRNPLQEIIVAGESKNRNLLELFTYIIPEAKEISEYISPFSEYLNGHPDEVDYIYLFLKYFPNFTPISNKWLKIIYEINNSEYKENLIIEDVGISKKFYDKFRSEDFANFVQTNTDYTKTIYEMEIDSTTDKKQLTSNQIFDLVKKAMNKVDSISLVYKVDDSEENKDAFISELENLRKIIIGNIKSVDNVKKLFVLSLEENKPYLAKISIEKLDLFEKYNFDLKDGVKRCIPLDLIEFFNEKITEKLSANKEEYVFSEFDKNNEIYMATIKLMKIYRYPYFLDFLNETNDIMNNYKENDSQKNFIILTKTIKANLDLITMNDTLRITLIKRCITKSLPEILIYILNMGISTRFFGNNYIVSVEQLSENQLKAEKDTELKEKQKQISDILNKEEYVNKIDRDSIITLLDLNYQRLKVNPIKSGGFKISLHINIAKTNGHVKLFINNFNKIFKDSNDLNLPFDNFVEYFNEIFNESIKEFTVLHYAIIFFDFKLLDHALKNNLDILTTLKYSLLSNEIREVTSLELLLNNILRNGKNNQSKYIPFLTKFLNYAYEKEPVIDLINHGNNNILSLYLEKYKSALANNVINNQAFYFIFNKLVKTRYIKINNDDHNIFEKLNDIPNNENYYYSLLFYNPTISYIPEEIINKILRNLSGDDSDTSPIEDNKRFELDWENLEFSKNLFYSKNDYINNVVNKFMIELGEENFELIYKDFIKEANERAKKDKEEINAKKIDEKKKKKALAKRLRKKEKSIKKALDKEKEIPKVIVKKEEIPNVEESDKEEVIKEIPVEKELVKEVIQEKEIPIEKEEVKEDEEKELIGLNIDQSDSDSLSSSIISSTTTSPFIQNIIKLDDYWNFLLESTQNPDWLRTHLGKFDNERLKEEVEKVIPNFNVNNFTKKIQLDVYIYKIFLVLGYLSKFIKERKIIEEGNEKVVKNALLIKGGRAIQKYIKYDSNDIDVIIVPISFDTPQTISNYEYIADKIINFLTWFFQDELDFNLPKIINEEELSASVIKFQIKRKDSVDPKFLNVLDINIGFNNFDYKIQDLYWNQTQYFNKYKFEGLKLEYFILSKSIIIEEKKYFIEKYRNELNIISSNRAFVNKSVNVLIKLIGNEDYLKFLNSTEI